MPIYKMDGKRGGKQKYRVRINYTDSLGKPRQIDRVAYGKDEASQLERELAYSLKEQKPAQKITVQALFEEYKIAKAHEVRQSTFSSTVQLMTAHVLPLLGGTQLGKLSPPTLQNWKNEINANSFTIGTKKAIYKKFHAVLNFAVKMGYISANPLDRVGNFQAPLEPPQKMDFYTVDEFQKFQRTARAYCETREPYIRNFYVFFCIAFFTGMRKGEIYALTWEDIKNNEIEVTKSLSQKFGGGDILTPPKNATSVRSISIPKPLQSVLNDHKEQLTALGMFSASNYICGGDKPVRDPAVRKFNEDIAALAGLKKIRLHDFRHSHASLLIQEGINIQEVARRLGHSDISTTLKTYAHLYPTEQDRAAKVLDNIEL